MLLPVYSYPCCQQLVYGKLRAQDLEVKRHWKSIINLDRESFHLPPTDILDRRPTFKLRYIFLTIFLKFVSASLVTHIAQDIY